MEDAAIHHDFQAGRTGTGGRFLVHNSQLHPDDPRIAADGVLTAVSEGRVTVSAGLDMGPAFSRFSAFLGIEVLRRADYRLKTLISSDASSENITTLVPTRVAVAGSNVAGFTSLSNGGQALVLWRSDSIQLADDEAKSITLALVLAWAAGSNG